MIPEKYNLKTNFESIEQNNFFVEIDLAQFHNLLQVLAKKLLTFHFWSPT